MKAFLLFILLTLSFTQTTFAKDGSTVLITGANRGIGLEFAKQFKAMGYQVIGTARKPEKATKLKALGVRVLQLDVTDMTSIKAMDDALAGQSIDILVNNAGYFYRNENTLATVNFQQMQKSFAINTLGPLRVIKVLIDNLQIGEEKKVINISSAMGSIEKSGGGSYSYRASKSALNMTTKNLSAEFGKSGFIFTVVHPGWVQTDMGGSSATYSVEESVTGLMKVINELGPDDNGKFYDLKGKAIPW